MLKRLFQKLQIYWDLLHFSENVLQSINVQGGLQKSCSEGRRRWPPGPGGGGPEGRRGWPRGQARARRGWPPGAGGGGPWGLHQVLLLAAKNSFHGLNKTGEAEIVKPSSGLSLDSCCDIQMINLMWISCRDGSFDLGSAVQAGVMVQAVLWVSSLPSLTEPVLDDTHLLMAASTKHYLTLCCPAGCVRTSWDEGRSSSGCSSAGCHQSYEGNSRRESSFSLSHWTASFYVANVFIIT